MLRRFWIDLDLEGKSDMPSSVDMGFGITAHSLDDALQLLRELVFRGQELPRLNRVKEDVDISMLEPKHVRANMGNPVVRGVWFPLGF